MTRAMQRALTGSADASSGGVLHLGQDQRANKVETEKMGMRSGHNRYGYQKVQPV